MAKVLSVRPFHLKSFSTCSLRVAHCSRYLFGLTGRSPANLRCCSCMNPLRSSAPRPLAACRNAIGNAALGGLIGELVADLAVLSRWGLDLSQG